MGVVEETGKGVTAVKKGEIDATDIITHTLSLDEGSRGYALFDNKEVGCIKVVLKP